MKDFNKEITLRHIRIFRSQWWKTLYSKALVLAEVGDRLDELYFHYKEIGRKGFGNIYINQFPPKNIKADVHTGYLHGEETDKTKDLWLHPTHFCPYPHLLSYQQLPDARDRKIIDIDVVKLLPHGLEGGNPLFNSVREEFAEYFSMMMKCNHEGRLIGNSRKDRLEKIWEFYDIVTQCYDIVMDAFDPRDTRGGINFTGGGLQLNKGRYSKREEYLEDGVVCKSNKTATQFMRLPSVPQLWGSHLTTNIPLNGNRGLFRYCNPAFYMRKKGIGVLLKKFELTYDSKHLKTMSDRIRQETGEKPDRYIMQRELQIKVMKEMGLEPKHRLKRGVIGGY